MDDSNVVVLATVPEGSSRSTASSSSSSNNQDDNNRKIFSIRLIGDPYESDIDGWEDDLFEPYDDDDDDTTSPFWGNGERDPSRRSRRRRRPSSSSLYTLGFGREYSLFESSAPRGGGADDDESRRVNDESDDDDDDDSLRRMEQYKRSQMERTNNRSSSSSSSSSSDLPSNNRNWYNNNVGIFAPQRLWRWPSSSLSSYQQQQRPKRRPFHQDERIVRVQEWWNANVRPTLQSLPKINSRLEPTTTIKLRKTFRPLKTIIRLGADYNTQLGVWQFKSSWEDAIIGGKLTLAGKELQLTKSWQLSVGAVEDLVTRLRFRAAINLQTFQAYARVGFRTERLTPINVVEGFTIWKRIPLDGKGGNIKLEVKANVALPEPEIEYSTETQRRSLIGMGDIEVSVDETNLLLDY